MDTRPSLILRGNRGVSVVFVALSLLMIFLFVCLAVDVGYMYVVKTQLQNGADSAALAGAAKLDGTRFANQTGARGAAKIFGEMNPAGRSASGNVNIYMASQTGTNQLTDSNDIVVGFWDNSAHQFRLWGDAAIPVDAVVNAVKVRTRRDVGDTADPNYDRRGEVPLFFTRVFGWNGMGAAAEAVAWRPARPTTALAICLNSCSLSPLPTNLYFNKNDRPDANHGLAFTEFSYDMSTNFGPNSTMAQYIDGRQKPPDVCGKSIAVNNAASQSIMNILSSEFTQESAATGVWEAIVPVLDVNSTGGSACPPDPEGTHNERYHVSGYAKISITRVVKNAHPYITLSAIECVVCPGYGLLGMGPALAQ